MAIYRDDNVTYVGAVIGEYSHMWMDGMEEVFHKVYDAETDSIIEIKTGYYGCDGQNMTGINATIDLDKETARKVLRVLKRDAIKAYAYEITSHKKRIVPGRRVKVIRGRKVKKGTELEVFWVGERPTYESRIYHWAKGQTEAIAGCYDKDHNKVWIKVEYLENITPIATPNAHKRNQMIKNWVRNTANNHMNCNITANILKIARG